MKSCRSLILTHLLMLLLLLTGEPMFAQTFVGGDILTNTTWTLAGSPYYAASDVRVVQGVELTVEAGVTVRFGSQKTILVEGSLNAQGTAADSVLFLTLVPSPDTGAWQGVQINPATGGTARFSYTRIAFASRGIQNIGTANPGTLFLSHSELRSCAVGLAGWNGSALEVRSCEFKENDLAVQAGDWVFRRCAFAANRIAVSQAVADIDSCTFTKQSEAALSGGGGQIQRSLFISNTIGLLNFGFTPTDSVNGCQFAENDTAAVATGSGARFFENEFCSNDVNFKVIGGTDVNAVQNCWCSLDTNLIVGTFVDGRTLPATGLVQIDPIQTNCEVISVVWPGDANDDGVATIADALYIGVAYNNTGPARAEPSVSWTGQSGLPWDLEFDFGTNYKHSDCDGNGLVNLADTLPIVQNLGQIHYKASGLDTHGTLPVIFEMPVSAGAGDSIQIYVNIGDAQHPATGVYGISFTLRPDSSLYKPLMQTDLSNTWLGTPGQDLHDVEVQNGTLHWAVFRNDHQDVSGAGKMGGVTLVMIDDLTKPYPVDSTLEIDNVVVIDKRGNPMDVDVQVVTCNPCGNVSFSVFPSIANARVRVHLDAYTAEGVDMFDQNGNLALMVEGPLQGQVELDTQRLQPGLYLIRVRLENGYLTRKVLIMR